MKNKLLKRIDEELKSIRTEIQDEEIEYADGDVIYLDGVITGKLKGLAKAKEIISMLFDGKGTNVLTIGDKIRMSNESLMEFIDCHDCRYCIYSKAEESPGFELVTSCTSKKIDCNKGILAYLNQPYKEVSN